MQAKQLLGILLLAVLVVVAASEDNIKKCTKEDRDYIFTPCDDETHTMKSIAYYTHACTPSDDPDVALRAPVSASCSLECSSGTWLSAEDMKCKSCPMGTFSHSGSMTISNFEELPDMATTFCSPHPCQGWQPSPGGAYITSGNQSIGKRYVERKGMKMEDESVESTFSMIVNIVRPSGGQLKFKYRVESERYFDGLYVYVNGSLIKNDHNLDEYTNFFITGMHHNWRSASIPLLNGRAAIRFVFSKDRNQDSAFGEDAGSDRAFLRDFEIVGAQNFARSCSTCAPGTFNNNLRQQECKLCPRGMTSERASADCSACPDKTWAPPGSPKCLERIPCGRDDYIPVFQQCSSGQSHINREWKLTNLRCLVDEEKAPKPDTVVCPACPSGYFFGPTGCIPCPAGTASVDGTCKDCPAGTAAVPTANFWNGFDSFGGKMNFDYFQTTCQGWCDECEDDNWCTTTNSDGFELASFPIPTPDGSSPYTVGIRNSLTNGATFSSTLKYNFKSNTDGTVRIRYMFYRPYASVSSTVEDFTAMMIVDGVERPLDTYFLTNGVDNNFDLIGEMSMDFYDENSDGNHDIWIKFRWDTRWSEAPSPVALVLLGMEVVGDSRGGASTCRQCPPGHHCPHGATRFVPCPRGQFGEIAGLSECTNCPMKLVSDELGATTCKPCPDGTRPPVLGIPDRCINTCLANVGGDHYDFTRLFGHVYGPAFRPGESAATTASADAANVYRFYVSPCTMLNPDRHAPGTYCPTNGGHAVEPNFACQRLNGDRSYSLGDRVNYEKTAAGNLAMFVKGGDYCHHRQLKRSTNITFICDSNAGSPGKMEYVDENPTCQYNFVIRTEVGCPACTPNSYQRIEGECEEVAPNISKRTRYYVKKTQCTGGTPLPLGEPIYCLPCTENSFSSYWGDCVNGQQTKHWAAKLLQRGCTYPDGSYHIAGDVPPFFEPESRACRKLDVEFGKNTFTVSLFAIALVIMLISVALTIISLKHQNLKQAYEQISASATGHEMPEIPSHEQDTERLEENAAKPAAPTPPPAADVPAADHEVDPDVIEVEVETRHEH